MQQGKPGEQDSQLLVNFFWCLVAVSGISFTVELNVFMVSVVNTNPSFEQCQGRRGFPVNCDFTQCFAKAKLSKVTHVGKLYKRNDLLLRCQSSESSQPLRTSSVGF